MMGMLVTILMAMLLAWFVSSLFGISEGLGWTATVLILLFLVPPVGAVVAWIIVLIYLPARILVWLITGGPRRSRLQLETQRQARAQRQHQAQP